MSKEECEAKILEKLNEINEIVLQYNPSNTYLGLFISVESISFNNNYWEDGMDKPINYCKFLKEDDENGEDE